MQNKCHFLMFLNFVVLMLFLISVLPANAADTAVSSLTNEGVMALKDYNYQLAIAKLKAALKLHPNDQLAMSNLVIAYNNYGLQLRNNPRAALKQFGLALYLDPNNTTTQGNVDRTIRMLGKDPQSFADRVALGKEARLSGEFTEAVLEYTAALKLKDDVKIHVLLGDVYLVLSENTKAISEYQAALRAGDSVDIELKLGRAYRENEQISEAIATYEKARALKSDDSDVQEALVAAWEEVLKENPMAAENHIGLGRALQYRGDLGQAEQEYQQALRIGRGKTVALARQLLKELAAAKVQAHQAHLTR